MINRIPGCLPSRAPAVRKLLLPRPQGRTTLETFLGPQVGRFVVLGRGRGVGRKHHPRLLRCGEYVDVRWQEVRCVERSDADKANRATASCVVAPDRDAAPGAAGDLLALAAVGRRVDDLDLALEQLDAVGFDHRVQREGSAALTLAPAAVAAVNEKGLRRHPVAHKTARTTAVAECCFTAHGSILPAAARIRTIGRAGFRRATSSNPAASYIDFAPNHIESSLDRPGLSTGYASRRATPRFLA